MPNPGVFLGSRKEFMMSQKPVYAAAVLEGYVKDAIANIERSYFKRYPIDLPHNEEPTLEHLASVDDSAPDPDEPIPDESSLGSLEFMLAMEVLEERRLLILKRKQQIKRWLEYQHMKDNDVDPLESGAQNPFTILLFQLTGIGYQKPRRRSAVNVWCRAHRAEIEEKATATLNAQKGPKRQKLAKIRESIANSMFQELSEEDRGYYKALAKEEHMEAVEKWKRDTTSPPSTKPEDRQKAIQALIRFIQPILDGICGATGWKATLAIGGPEPANGGRFRMVTVNSGYLSGPVKMNFTRSEAAAYHKYFVPMFGEFLRKCFSIEECKSRALSSTEGFETIEQLAQSSEHSEAIDLGFLAGSSTESSFPSSSTHVHPSRTSLSSSSTSSSTHINLSQTSSSSSTHPNPSQTSASQPPPLFSITSGHSATATAEVAANEDLSSNGSISPSSRSSSASPPSSPASPNQEPPSRSASPAPQGHHPSSHHLSPPPSPPASPIQPASPSKSPLSANTMPMDVDIHDDPIVPPHLPLVSLTSLPNPDLNPTNRTTSLKRALLAGDDDSDSPSHPPKKLRPAPPVKSTTIPNSKPRPKPRPVKPTTNPSNATNTSTIPHVFNVIEPTLGPSHSSDNAQLTSSTPILPSIPQPGSSTSSLPSGLDLTSTALSPASVTMTTASTSHYNSNVVAPVPAWFQSAMHQFTICPTTINNTTVVSLGSDWSDLVSAWSKFEARSAYGEDKKDKKMKLSPKNRPQVVGAWIARARSSSYKPEISNLGSFKDSFWSWWTALQPKWRVVDGEIQASSLDGDWSSLSISGVNGIVSVMAALLYWGLNARGSPTHVKHWTHAIKECTAVFSVL